MKKTFIELAQKHELKLDETSLTVNESGVDFQVAHGSDSNGSNWILRVPRRSESMRHATQEKQALDFIKKQTSFEVPDWTIFSDDLIAYKELSGTPAATIDMEQQGYVWTFDETNAPESYHRSLGKVLAELHALDPKPFKDIGVGFLTPYELRTTMKKRMDRVKERYAINAKLWERWQTWLDDESYWLTHVGVTHGDLHPGHIITTRDHSVTGLIDWTEVGVGDVGVDFMSHYLLFGEDGLTKLIDAYEQAGGQTWPRMLEHISELYATSALTVAEYAEVSGLKEMEEAAKQMLAGETN
ncbi:LOW QUALITY PROTEIN: macrolide 2-phosphotransferase [Bacillus sp. JCM 19045]|nr:LOW QUALITY PROTEIN: macrolide 2-phosphotransferase [Bacillus sp. JCM 19045]